MMKSKIHDRASSGAPNNKIVNTIVVPAIALSQFINTS